MMLTFHLLCLIAIIVQGITCQGIGNLNAGFKNGLPFGANYANSLVDPRLGSLGLVGPGYMDSGCQGLVGNGMINPGLIGPGLGGSGLVGPGFTSTGQASGGGFVVTSTSPISPTGVSILAENLAIEGPLNVGGHLPFLGTVGLEGALPATGSGTVSYGCGAENIGITSDIGSPYGLAGQYGPTGGQYGPAAGQYGPAGGQFGLTAGQYGPTTGQYGPLTGQYGSGLGGQGIGASLAGFNSGLGEAFGAGLVGPGVGSGMIGN